MTCLLSNDLVFWQILGHVGRNHVPGELHAHVLGQLGVGGGVPLGSGLTAVATQAGVGSRVAVAAQAGVAGGQLWGGSRSLYYVLGLRLYRKTQRRINYRHGYFICSESKQIHEPRPVVQRPA